MIDHQNRIPRHDEVTGLDDLILPGMSDRAKQAIQRLAVVNGLVTSYHLLLSLIGVEGMAIDLFEKHEVEELGEAQLPGFIEDDAQLGETNLNHCLLDAVSKAVVVAKAFGSGYIGSEHLLIGLSDCGGSRVQTRLTVVFGDTYAKARLAGRLAAKLDMEVPGLLNNTEAIPIHPQVQQLVASRDTVTSDVFNLFREQVRQAAYGADAVNSGHVLIALVRHPSFDSLLGHLNTDRDEPLTVDAIVEAVDKTSDLREEVFLPGVEYTQDVVRALVCGNVMTVSFNDHLVDVEHVLLGLVHRRGSIAEYVLYRLGLDTRKVAEAICRKREIPLPQAFWTREEKHEDAWKGIDLPEGVDADDFTVELASVVQQAYELADANQVPVNSMHLLDALLRVSGQLDRPMFRPETLTHVSIAVRNHDHTSSPEDVYETQEDNPAPACTAHFLAVLLTAVKLSQTFSQVRRRPVSLTALRTSLAIHEGSHASRLLAWCGYRRGEAINGLLKYEEAPLIDWDSDGPYVSERLFAGETLYMARDRLMELSAIIGKDVQFDFNGVTIVVNENSKPELISRDYSRCLGYPDARQWVVGPVCPEVLSQEEQEADAEIDRQHEERMAPLREAAARKAAAEKALYQGAILAAPEFEFKEGVEEKWAEDTKVDPEGDMAAYTQRTIDYAVDWGRLMQGRMAGGESVADCADDCARLADYDGISGFMHGAAAALLATYWVHGEDLRQWHNLKTSPKQGEIANEEGGTLNPAVMTIG